MIMESEQQQFAEKRILILCVDRDDDLQKKADVKTPITGRQETLDAAVALALRDPEEPDANAMFEAVRIYDRLKEEKKPDELIQIAVVAGSELGGVGADRKIVAELSRLLISFPASEVILVTDGYSDEVVLPLVQSRVAVSSVRRIIVKHSESIEETAAVFSRYAKMLIYDPRYSRWALGLPGLLILTLGLLYVFNLLSLVWIVFVFVVSIFMLVKGFGVDRAAFRFYKWAREFAPPPLRVQTANYSAVAGLLCIIVAVYLGWMEIAGFISGLNQSPTEFYGWLSLLPQGIGHFIIGAIDLVIVGICVVLSGRAVRQYLEHDVRLLRNIALIVTIGWSRQIFTGTAQVLMNPELGYENLVFSIVIGVLIGIASALVVFVLHRSFRTFFEQSMEQVEKLG